MNNLCPFGSQTTKDLALMSINHSQIKTKDGSIIQVTKKDSKRIFQFGNYIVECPDGPEDEPITGETIVKHGKTHTILYEGMFLNSQKSGYGIEYDQNGNLIFEGQFQSDKRNGWGRTTQYQGQFKDGDFDGWGRFVNQDTFYEGYFVAGNYHGIGIRISSKHDGFQKIEGIQKQVKIQDFLQEQMALDSTSFFNKYNIEQVYIGQWAKGLKNGSGKLWKENGFWFTGQFAYDTIHGTGAIHRSNVEGVEKGIFSKGQFRGGFSQS